MLLDQQNSQRPPPPPLPTNPFPQPDVQVPDLRKESEGYRNRRQGVWLDRAQDGTDGAQRRTRRGHGSPSPHLYQQGRGVPGVSGQDPRREQSSWLRLESDSLWAEEPGRTGDLTETWIREREMKSELREPGAEIGARSAHTRRSGSCLSKGLSSGLLRDWSRGPGTRRAGMRRALTRSRWRRRRRRAAPAGRERPGPARARGA